MLIRRRSRDEGEADRREPEETVETDVARRVLAHASSPEQRLEQLLAERSRELEEQAARFEQAMDDLERREQLLRDMRASVERMLRLGATDLDEREVELRELGRDVADRQARLGAEEEELARRRSELGAVELKREAVERRERALAAREAELAAAEERGPAEGGAAVAAGPARVEVCFVPGASYRLLTTSPRELVPGDVVEVDGAQYLVARIGPSPLPRDRRPCAYLELGPGAVSPPRADSVSAGST